MAGDVPGRPAIRKADPQRLSESRRATGRSDLALTSRGEGQRWRMALRPSLKRGPLSRLTAFGTLPRLTSGLPDLGRARPFTGSPRVWGEEARTRSQPRAATRRGHGPRTLVADRGDAGRRGTLMTQRCRSRLPGVPRMKPFEAQIQTLRRLQREFQAHTGVRDYSARDGVSPGICHQVAREHFVDPGDFIQATDSHTCMGGGNNALTWGVGATEYAALIYSGFTFVQVPESIRFVLKGKLRDDCTAKDLMLHILATYAVEEKTLDRVMDRIGLRTGSEGHIEFDDYQNTNVPGVYAVGDVTPRLALTPVAVAAGRKLADRLFGGVSDARLDYQNIPSVVFSHPPLGTIGMSEQQARERYGADVHLYKQSFVPMQLALAERPMTTRFKLICVGAESRIVGMQMLGPGVDEILQGFAVAIKMGATKADLDATLAIHPTSAEEMVLMGDRVPG